MPTEVAVVIALAVGIGLLMTVVALVARRPAASTPGEARAARGASLGLAPGMVSGAGLGLILWMATGEFVLWIVFLGAGMTLGLAIGSAVTTRPR